MSTTGNPVDTEILIKILTAFESGGMDAAIATANELGKTVDKTSKEGDTLAAIMDLVNNKSADANTIFAGLSQTLHGGMGAVKGFGTAVKGLGSALGIATGPLSLLISTVQLGVTAWMAYTHHTEEAAEASRKAAEEAEAAAKQAAEALEKDMAAAADAVTAKLKGITDELKASVDQANKLSDATASVNDAQLGLELAELDAKLVGETDEEKIADIKQQKSRLKVERERERLDEEYAAQGREISAMDKAEQQAKGTADEKRNELDQAEKRWSDEQAAAEDRVSAAQKASKKAQEEWEVAQSPNSPVYDAAGLHGLQVAARAAEKEVGTAEAALKETTDRIANERAVLEHGIETANQNYDNLVAANAPQRQILQKQMDANRIKAQTLEVKSDASEHQYSIDTLGIYDRKQEAAAKAAAEKAAADKAAAEAEAAEREKNMSFDERLAHAQSLVIPEYQRDGQHYTEDVGRETKSRADSAIAEAATKIRDGENDAEVVEKLISTLQNLGAVIPDLGRLVTELDKMDGEIDQIRSQLNHLR